MTRALSAFALLTVLVLFQARGLAQEDYDEDSKANTNLGFIITAPLNPTSQFVNVGGGLVAGAGYNVSKRHSFIGEFMWNHFGASDAALNPIRDALGTHDVHGHANILALTGNYRYELRGRTAGVYFIGGGGWYHRTATVNNHVVTGSTIDCTRAWRFWGFQCTSGTVVSDQTLASSTQDVLGANVGMGVTFKVAEPRYRMYIEARYHYIPTNNIKTELIPITVGIRF